MTEQKENQLGKLPDITTVLPKEIIYYGLTEEQIDNLAKGRIGSNIYLSLATFLLTIGFSSFIVLSTIRLAWQWWIIYIILAIGSGIVGTVLVFQWGISIYSISKMVRTIKERAKPKAIQEHQGILSKKTDNA